MGFLDQEAKAGDDCNLTRNILFYFSVTVMRRKIMFFAFLAVYSMCKQPLAIDAVKHMFLKGPVKQLIFQVRTITGRIFTAGPHAV